jgi:hypothetical protein
LRAERICFVLLSPQGDNDLTVILCLREQQKQLQQHIHSEFTSFYQTNYGKNENMHFFQFVHEWEFTNITLALQQHLMFKYLLNTFLKEQLISLNEHFDQLISQIFLVNSCTSQILLGQTHLFPIYALGFTMKQSPARKYQLRCAQQPPKLFDAF